MVLFIVLNPPTIFNLHSRPALPPALKWSQHFCEDYNPRKYRGTLFSTPAVPFRLMQLPDVYQVLLERFGLVLLSWDEILCELHLFSWN